MMTRKDLNSIRSDLSKHKQEHVLKYWDSLSPKEQQELLSDIGKVDFDQLETLKSLAFTEKQVKKQNITPDEIIEPEKLSEDDRATYKKAGRETLRKGKVAFFVVSGGQGSRLGYDRAKGIFPISPIQEKSLFQIHSEKIAAINAYYKYDMPFIIMTSIVNHNETVDFFKEHDFFGLKEDSVFFITQGVLPAIDNSGKLILAQKHHIFFSPDGHGGCLKAMNVNNIPDILGKRNVEYISYFQVDNPLVHIADPLFIGLTISKQADMASKLLKKRDPEEKIGSICRINGRTGIIEYSDLAKEYKFAKDESGEYIYAFGSIAIHLLSLSFIRQFYNKPLPFHVAKKKIMHVAETGETITPDSPNGIKFEQFVFDALQYADSTLNMATAREKDFSPLKNKEGEDSIDTCTRGQAALFASWLTHSGYNVPVDKNGDPSIKIEIEPGFAFDEDTFKERINGKSLSLDTDLLIKKDSREAI
ncbi:UTP--glucose-1-phosphate uridylyltransferase [Spirochaetota bacterium]